MWTQDHLGYYRRCGRTISDTLGYYPTDSLAIGYGLHTMEVSMTNSNDFIGIDQGASVLVRYLSEVWLIYFSSDLLEKIVASRFQNVLGELLSLETKLGIQI